MSTERLVSFGRNKLFLFSILPLFLFSVGARAAIFGVDDRKEVKLNPKMEKMARSTALMVSPLYVTKNSKGLLDLDFPLLKDSYGICPTEPFAQQPVSPIACTGFLIGPDLLMTAGHCMINVGEQKDVVTPYCSSFSWLFDFQLKADGTVDLKDINPDNVVACKRIIHVVHEYLYTPSPEHYEYMRDFAIIQLERPMLGRTPFVLSKQDVQKSDRLTAIGYPKGSPAKFSPNGIPFDLSNPNYVRTDLDILGGNSGGPVLNQRDEVVGIVVRSFADADYVDIPNRQCAVVNRCDIFKGTCLQSDTYPLGTQIQRVKDLTSF